MSVREDLAEALDLVEGIQASPYFKQSTTPGHAYLQLERIDYPNPFGGVVRWNVVVVLPQDYANAERYIETNLPALRGAIEPHMFIDSVTPQRLDINGAVIPCLFINGHREED